jgi:hypothetical protein
MRAWDNLWELLLNWLVDQVVAIRRADRRMDGRD